MNTSGIDHMSARSFADGLFSVRLRLGIWPIWPIPRSFGVASSWTSGKTVYGNRANDREENSSTQTSENERRRGRVEAEKGTKGTKGWATAHLGRRAAAACCLSEQKSSGRRGESRAPRAICSVWRRSPVTHSRRRLSRTTNCRRELDFSAATRFGEEWIRSSIADLITTTIIIFIVRHSQGDPLAVRHIDMSSSAAKPSGHFSHRTA